MDKTEQIVEMAEIARKVRNEVKAWERLKTDEEIAEAIYNAGYRKASDVVPKSEVNKELQAWADLYADSQSKWEKAYEELEIKLANAKSDIVRKIFEEIEKLQKVVLEPKVNMFGYITTSSLKGAMVALSDIAELKKKCESEEIK